MPTQRASVGEAPEQSIESLSMELQNNSPLVAVSNRVKASGEAPSTGVDPVLRIVETHAKGQGKELQLSHTGGRIKQATG